MKIYTINENFMLIRVEVEQRAYVSFTKKRSLTMKYETRKQTLLM